MNRPGELTNWKRVPQDQLEREYRIACLTLRVLVEDTRALRRAEKFADKLEREIKRRRGSHEKAG